jgi:hypothetical protein
MSDDNHPVFDLSVDQRRARELVTSILRDADWVIPRLITLLAHDDLVPGDDTDDETLAPFLERLAPFVTNVLELRALSHKEPTS